MSSKGGSPPSLLIADDLIVALPAVSLVRWINPGDEEYDEGNPDDNEGKRFLRVWFIGDGTAGDFTEKTGDKLIAALIDYHELVVSR